jgi:serine/threonine protein kinase
MDPQPVQPTTIGRFVVESVLGSGGMGTVYKATDPTLKRTVAIKTVRPGLDNPELLDRLLREAQACARLHHKNIVTIYEAGQIEGTVYIAMEYLVGESLATVLTHGTIPFDETLSILIQVLDALEHVHRAGIIHRDIKPGNIYRESDGSIKLVDFGLARVQQAESLTMTGAFMATPGYASPEQFRGDIIDRRTDIYSTGVVAYEMISGHRPFAGDLSSLLYKVVHEPPPPLDMVWSRTYPDIERIVRKALAKMPDERYQTAAEMRDDLKAVIARSPHAPIIAPPPIEAPSEKTTAAPAVKIPVPTAPPVSPKVVAKGRPVNGALLGVVALVLVLIGIGVWLLASRNTESQTNQQASPASPPAAPSTPAPVPAAAGPPPAATAPPTGLPLPSADGGATPTTTAPAAQNPSDGRQPEPTIESPAAAPPVTPPGDRAQSTAPEAQPPAAPDNGRASTPPPQNNATRGSAERGRAPAVAPARRPDPARCARLTERASLGEVLTAPDREFLRNNCGSAR